MTDRLATRRDCLLYAEYSHRIDAQKEARETIRTMYEALRITEDEMPEHDEWSLAQPSPLRYVPSITTDGTSCMHTVEYLSSNAPCTYCGAGLPTKDYVHRNVLGEHGATRRKPPLILGIDGRRLLKVMAFVGFLYLVAYFAFRMWP